MKKINFKIRRKFIILFAIISIFAFFCTNIFAREIDIYATGRIGETDTYYRVYSPIHPAKIAASIKGPGNTIYNNLIKDSPIKYNKVNTWTPYKVVESSGPADTNLYYNKTGVIFHTAELSNYPAYHPNSGTDRTKYSYAKYDLKWSTVNDVQKAINIRDNSDYTVVGRPTKKSASELNNIKKYFYPMYDSSSKGGSEAAVNGYVRPYQTMIFSTANYSDSSSPYSDILAANSASQIRNSSYYANLRNDHITVVDYKISKAGYEDIVNKLGGSAVKGNKSESASNDEYYIYMSDRTVTSGGPTVFGNGVFYSDTIADYYNAIFPADGISVGWANSEKGVKQSNTTEVYQFASAINGYDNKFHFTTPPNRVRVRYYDVAKGNLEVDREILTTKTIFEKLDNSKFNYADITNMVLEEKSISNFINDKRGFNIEVPSGYEYIGYNVEIGTKGNYSNKTNLVVGHKDNKTYPGADTSEEIYVDVFVNSKKKVYVRHINMTQFYNDAQNRFNEISFAQLNNTNLLLQASGKTSVLFDKNNNKLSNINANFSKLGYSECFTIDWDKKLEITNIKDENKEYLKSFSVDAYRYSSAMDAFEEEYNKGHMAIAPKDKDARVISASNSSNTYVDMFYVTRAPEIGCIDEVADAGRAITPNGKLVFEATDSKFESTTANELSNSSMTADKIPSSEELKYGILGVKEYIIARADTKCVSDRVLIDNGKNYFSIDYEYNNPGIVSFYGLRDDMKMYDKNSQIGSYLFSDSDKTFNMKLNNEYLGYLNGATLEEGAVNVSYTSDKIPCSKCNGDICKNYYVEVSIKNMSLHYKGNELIHPYEKTTGKIEYKKERCKYNSNGNVVVDEAATVYKTPSVPKLEVNGYKDKLQADVNAANNIATVKDMNYLYDGSNKETIPGEKYNGIRVPSGKFGYRLIPNASSGTPIDTVNDKTLTERKREVEEVSIYTPVIAKTKLESSDDFVNHTGEELTSGEIIQKNVPFTIYPETTGLVHSAYTQLTDFAKYTKEFYLKFNFDIQYVEYFHNGSTSSYSRDDTMKAAGSWIRVPKGDYIRAQAVYDPNTVQNEVVESLSSEYYIKTIAINSPSNGYVEAMQLNNGLGSVNKNVGTMSHRTYHQMTFENEYKYMAYKKQETSILGRIYDFRITDLVDIDWKYVFRESDAINHTGRFYYAGTHKWDMLSSMANQMVERGSAEVGTNPQRVLPVGPYKHTNTGYVKGPKLGYKFAFDIKTTGSISEDVGKSINITPKFYYISKDGNRYLENIHLYYKNSSGRYIKVGSSADKYKVAMRPADGLRHLVEYERSYNKVNLSKDMISIGSLSEIELKQDTNMATNENAFLQIWYGEYKLPNSTVAVDAAVDDLDKPLTDGYIGVKFEISCVEKESGRIVKTIYYGANDLNATSTNTSQWDYERYLGSKPGEVYNGSIRLANGSWNINNDLYQKIKGTVVLYETDERAADEFDTGAAS